MHYSHLIFVISTLLSGIKAEAHTKHAGLHEQFVIRPPKPPAITYPDCPPSPTNGSSICWRYTDTSVGTRKYLVSFPESYTTTKPFPLIFSFHGRTKFAEDQVVLSRFADSTVNNKSIAVYPQGWGDYPQWQGDPEATTDDIAFTLQMIKELTGFYNISSDQIYATGKSNGGGFMNLLACDFNATSKIAAFAAASGAFYMDGTVSEPGCRKHPDGPLILPTCNPNTTAKPIRFMEFHGRDDCTIPYAGGYDASCRGMTHSVADVVTSWVTSKCDPCEVQEDPCNGDTIKRYSWNCDGTPNAVVHYEIPNLQHCWPSTIDGNGDCPAYSGCEDDSDCCETCTGCCSTCAGCCTTCIDASKIMMEWLFNSTLLDQTQDSVVCTAPIPKPAKRDREL